MSSVDKILSAMHCVKVQVDLVAAADNMAELRRAGDGLYRDFVRLLHLKSDEIFFRDINLKENDNEL